MNKMKMMVAVCSMLMAGVQQVCAQRTGILGTFVKKTPQQQQSGTYIPPGGTAPVPNGYRPTIVGGSNSSGVSGTYVAPVQNQSQGTYVPSGGTAPVPNGFKPDIIGTSPNGILTVNGVERPDLMQGGAQDTYNDNSGSSNSSSSSSAIDKMCPHCNGSGRCHTCNGKKYYIPYVGANTTPCSICNQTGLCTLCHGSGKFGKYRGY